MIHRCTISQVALTGANTDLQLHLFEVRLIERLRLDLPPGTKISLHTNGRLALEKVDVLNAYDRVCISFPSFIHRTYRRVIGVPGPPDLETILRRSCIPIKLSCVLTAHNLPELGEYLRRCRELGVRRVTLRKLYGDRRPWAMLLDPEALGLTPVGAYSSPIYDYEDLEVTLWDFRAARCRAINLFSSGEITAEYLVAGDNRPAVLRSLPMETLDLTAVTGQARSENRSAHMNYRGKPSLGAPCANRFHR